MHIHDEELIAWGTVILSALIYATISPAIGTLYGIMSLAYAVKVETGLKRGIEVIKQPQKWSDIIIRTSGLFIIWIFISTLITSFLQPQFGLSVFSVSGFRILFSSTLIDAISINNPLIKLLVFSLYIPIVENPFFLSVVLIWFASALKIPVIWTSSRKMFECALLVGLSAILFHSLTIFALQPTMTLEMVLFASLPYFILFTIFSLFVFKHNQLIETIIVHILLNLGAMIATLYIVLGVLNV